VLAPHYLFQLTPDHLLVQLARPIASAGGCNVFDDAERRLRGVDALFAGR
jgi:hypothetical protein